MKSIPSLWALLMIVIIFAQHASAQDTDTTQEELLEDFSLLIRFGVCNSKLWEDDDSWNLREAISDVMNDYCALNATNCGALTFVENSFSPRHIAFLDSFPKSPDFYALEIKFVVMYPTSVVLKTLPQRSLMHKKFISAAIASHMRQISQRIGWNLLSYETYPKYDEVTEFMNVAMLPIGLMIAVSMIGLAFCATSFEQYVEIFMGSGDMVSENDSTGMEAIQRVKLMIEDQKRQEQLALAMEAARQNRGQRASDGQILNAANLPPQIKISAPNMPGDYQSDADLSVDSDFNEHLIVAQQKSSRRPSMVDMIQAERNKKQRWLNARRNQKPNNQPKKKANMLLFSALKKKSNAG